MNVFDDVKQLMMSKTFQHLTQLAQTLPADTGNPDELKAALSICGLDLIDALDNGRIHFDNEVDKAVLYELLTVTLDYAIDGGLKRAQPVKAH